MTLELYLSVTNDETSLTDYSQCSFHILINQCVTFVKWTSKQMVLMN